MTMKKSELYDRLYEYVKENDGYIITLPKYIKIIDDGKKKYLDIKALVLKYSYSNGNDDICNLVMIDKDFNTWDVCDYCNKEQLLELVKATPLWDSIEDNSDNDKQ